LVEWCLNDAMKLRNSRKRKDMKLSITLFSYSPFISFIMLSLSSLNRCQDKDLLANKAIAKLFVPNMWPPPTNVILNMMIMPSKMNCYPCKGDEFVNDITYSTLACINAKGHTITNFTNKCACITTKGEMTYNRNLCGVTYRSNFILNTIVNTFKK
jgi:hypothetical protein